MKKLALAAIITAVLAPAAAFAADGGTACYDLYQPVCAAQQVECFAAPCYPVYKTYSNSCFAGLENATILHEGECTAAETGPIKPAPTYTPPPGCVAWFDGCNSCGKAGTGAVCTQMACTGTPKAGYCTAYATTTTTVHTSTTTTGTSTSTTATSSAATTTPAAPQAHSFLYRFWHAIISWFTH